MLSIESLTEASPLLESAQDLFRSYGEFLRNIQACHAFNFPRFAEEIQTLPAAYTSANGELLLALAAPGMPAGCIAFRSAPPEAAPEACEIKRLFVLPEHRGQGIAERLVLTALDHARARGFRSAILDTEPSTMYAAQSLYRKLGFLTYIPTHPHNPIDVTYLQKSLFEISGSDEHAHRPSEFL